MRQSRINCKINRKDPTAITITSNDGQESRNVSEEIASKCEQSAWPYYWIYFTNWSWTLFVTSFLFDTTLVALRFYEERKSINVDLVGHPTQHINDGNYTATWFLSRNHHMKRICVFFVYFNLNFHYPLGIHLGLRISWILSSIAYPIALVITIIYWWMIYDGSTGFRLYNNINCHAVQVN